MSDRGPRPGRLGRLGRWRVPVLVVATYAAVVAAFHAGLFAAIVAARLAGNDPRVAGSELPDVRHLRRVDTSVWAGAQPDREAYRRLARMGVRLVVELQTGATGDPRDDDPAFLSDLGIDYLHLPVVDGRVPTPAQVRRFAAAVAASDGLVFLHCGGGVGRSTSMQAGYLALTGRDPSLAAQVAVGPPTLEQMWYVARLRPGAIDVTNPVVTAVSRYALDAPRSAANWLLARL